VRYSWETPYDQAKGELTVGNIFSKKDKAEDGKAQAKNKAPVKERRKHPRFTVAELTYLYPQSKPPVQVTILDVSYGGCKIETRERIEMGSKLGLCLYVNNVVVKCSINLLWENRLKLYWAYGAEWTTTDPKEKAHIKKYVDNASFNG
jgi:hypothetical protein